MANINNSTDEILSFLKGVSKRKPNLNFKAGLGEGRKQVLTPMPFDREEVNNFIQEITNTIQHDYGLENTKLSAFYGKLDKNHPNLYRRGVYTHGGGFNEIEVYPDVIWRTLKLKYDKLGKVPGLEDFQGELSQTIAHEMRHQWQFTANTPESKALLKRLDKYKKAEKSLFQDEKNIKKRKHLQYSNRPHEVDARNYGDFYKKNYKDRMKNYQNYLKSLDNNSKNVINKAPNISNKATAVDEVLDLMNNRPIDSPSTGLTRDVNKQQAKSWQKEMVKPKNITYSHYENMQTSIKGIHEYAKAVPKPVFPLDPNTPMEEVQEKIQQYNRWHSAQRESINLKTLGRDLKQNQERYERAQANIDETIARQKKNEAIEKDYENWKQQRIDKAHTEAIEMNKQFDAEKLNKTVQGYEDNFVHNNYDQYEAAIKEGKDFDILNTNTYAEAHEEALKMNQEFDQLNEGRVHDIDDAYEQAIDEDLARERIRQQQLEENLPDIFKNKSDKPNVIPDKNDVINIGPDDFEVIDSSDAPEEIVNGGLNNSLNNGNTGNTGNGSGNGGGSNNVPPKNRKPNLNNEPPVNGLIVANQNTQLGNSRLNVDDYDDNIIEGTFKVLDDAPDPPKMPSKASVLGTAGAVIGAISDYKDARRKGHGVISSGLRAAGSFVLGEMLGWKGQLALMAVRAVPGAVVKGADMLYKENRKMNSAANQQVFGGSQFQDTQQLATMRQSGMEMAKMSQYNLQQTLMGNEATYLHR